MDVLTLWIYKQTHDNNFAPHVSRGRLSLACCKPDIRRVAARQDWVLSVAGKTNRFGAEYGQLVSLFLVEECISFEEYAQRPDCSARADNLFLVDDESGELVARDHLEHHADPSEQAHDLSGRNVLLSSRFRYFPAGSGPHLARIGASEFITTLRNFDRRPVSDSFLRLVESVFEDPHADAGA